MTDVSRLASSAYSQALEVIASVEPRIAEATRAELADQRASLKLIASENYASPAVLMTMGTWFSDKYAEGTVGHRFYAGCQNVDTVESIAAEHAHELFGAEYAYVQPHSGIDANLVAFWSILAHRVEGPWLEKAQAKNVNELTDADWEELRRELGNQRLLGMSLDAGGHLTHGAAPNQSGKWFNAIQYGVRKQDNLLDYDQVEELAKEHKPKMIIAGGSAIPRQIDFKRMREIADMVGAYLHVDMAHFAGLVAAGEHPSPFPHAHVATTTTHKTLRGPRGGMILTNDEALAKKFNSAIFPGIQGGPLMHVIAAKAVAFGEALRPEFKTYIKQVIANAQALSDQLIKGGLDTVTHGTDTHVVLVDLRPKGVTGNIVDKALGRAHITCNKNGVPFDPEKPTVTSGIRLGSPAGTTRGFGEAEFRQIADWIIEVVDGLAANGAEGNADIEAKVKTEVEALCARFPIYPNL